MATHIIIHRPDPAYCGAVLGPRTCWGTRNQNHQWAHKRRLCSKVCWPWLVNQRWTWWQGLGNTQRQGWELISGPCPGAKARFLSLNRTQSRVVTNLLTGHNTLRRHLHLMRLSDSPLCRRCGAEDENLAHILCECEALASLRHEYLGSFFLDPEDIKHISLGATWKFSKVTGLPWIDMEHKGSAN